MSAALAALACLLLGGFGWLRLCGRPSAAPEGFGLAFAAGAAWLGLVVAAAAAIAPVPPLLFPLLAAAPAALLLLPRTSASAAPGPPAALARAWLGFLPAAAVGLATFWLAARWPVWNVDAQMRWALHGQWLAAYGTAVAERVQDPSWASTHPSYPPLVPGVVALALGFGADRASGVRLPFPGFFLALLALLYGQLRRRQPRTAPWLTLAFALTPCFAYLPRYARASGLATTGLGSDDVMADVPLALLLTAVSLLFLELLETPGRRAAGLSALLGAGAVLCKQEGLVFAPCALLLGFLAAAAAGRRPLPLYAIPLLAAAAAALLWKYAARHMPVMPGEDYAGAGAGALFQNLDRLPGILGRLGTEFVDVRLWGPLWLAPLAWLGLRFWQRRRPALAEALLLLWLLAALALIVAAFLATGWRDGNYLWLMDVSLTRLLMHHAPLCLLLWAPASRPSD